MRIAHDLFSILHGMANHCGLPATTRQQGPHPAFLHHCILHTHTAVIASAKCHGANIAQLLVHQIMQRESDAIAISMHSPFYLLAPIDKRIGNTAPKNRKKWWSGPARSRRITQSTTLSVSQFAPWFERKPCLSVSVKIPVSQFVGYVQKAESINLLTH